MVIMNRPPSPKVGLQYDKKIAGIAGLYDLQETIGRGHFAVVKLARHCFTGQKVAVKVIDKTKLDDIARGNLFKEVRCMKLVQHPHVVRLYEVIDTHTKLYLILEFADGGDMYDYIMKHDSGLDEEMARKYFRQILRAISYCHKLHVVHRDLKPENVVFFEKLGVVKLTDFGFSNNFHPDQKLETSCGSLAYSAPEILLGDSYHAPAVDVWSLGVILFMLVSGHPPFQEANDSETLMMIMDCKFELPENVSDKCQDLIRHMLVRQPEYRYALKEIIEHEWVGGEAMLAELSEYDMPVISRHLISAEDHAAIIQKMVNGQVAGKETIMRAIETDEYTHITATYYLLAEKRMRKNQSGHGQQMGTLQHKKQSSDFPNLLLSPRYQHGGLLDMNVQRQASGVEYLVSPCNSRTTEIKSLSSKSRLRNVHFASVTFNAVHEEDEEGDSDELIFEGQKLEVQPSKSLDPQADSHFSGHSSSKEKTSGNSQSGSPRQLHSVKSSPTLLIKGCEDTEKALAVPKNMDSMSKSDPGMKTLTSSTTPLTSNKCILTGDRPTRYENRKKMLGARSGSNCSSSDASDDDSGEIRKCKDKLKNIPRRDSHDDSSNDESRPPTTSSVNSSKEKKSVTKHTAHHGTDGKSTGNGKGRTSGGGKNTTATVQASSKHVADYDSLVNRLQCIAEAPSTEEVSMDKVGNVHQLSFSMENLAAEKRSLFKRMSSHSITSNVSNGSSGSKYLLHTKSMDCLAAAAAVATSAKQLNKKSDEKFIDSLFPCAAGRKKKGKGRLRHDINSNLKENKTTGCDNMFSCSHGTKLCCVV